MSDMGEMATENAIRAVDRKLRSTYRQAQKELKEKLSDFNRRHAERDREKRRQLAEGEISLIEYQSWQRGQAFQKSQWKHKIDQVNKVIHHSNQEAARIVRESQLNVFAENYNYFSYLGEKITGMQFGIYNTQSVTRLLKEEPQILPEWDIDKEKDYTWNQKKVNNAINQGIIQGESIADITKRLCGELATQNERRMELFARTAMTEAQNAGRQQQMDDAADMGIEINKRWIATLDSRTRDSHKEMDGEEVPYNKEFSNGLQYPGDPHGEPAEVYNCRCTMVSIYPKYEDRSKQDVRRMRGEYTDSDGKKRSYSYLTSNPDKYKEWKNGKIKDGEVKSAQSMGKKTEKFIESLNIGQVPFDEHTKQPTMTEIVDRISQFDPTDGSCASVAFAYIANKAGYDVKDFRGGDSRLQFSLNSTIRDIARLDGVKRIITYGKNDFLCANKLLQRMEEGKEYFLSVGHHAAIVKKTKSGYKYLELQGRKGTNGYKTLTDKQLDYRFDCEVEHKDKNGKPTKATNVLIDIESLGKSDAFIRIMQYINSRH